MPFWKNKTRFLSALLILIGIVYPFIVYFGLMAFSPLVVGIALLAFLLLRLIVSCQRKRHLSEIILLGGVFVIIALLLVTNNLLAVQAYPIIMSLSFAVLFGYSMLFPPTIIERIARLRKPNLQKSAVIYTRKVTCAWVMFFLLNASISSWTVLYANLAIWTLYNGFIAYMLMGLMFAAEYLIRHIIQHNRVS